MLLVNDVLRLLLCPVALLASWVPLTLLWKHSEFPAWVFVGVNWLSIVFTLVNAAIWRSDESLLWYPGYGWCDLQAYIQVPLATIFSASVCAIMRRLSEQVGLTRVAGLSGRERRHRIAVQALIMFPIPLLQVGLTVFVQGVRYVLVPVSGCSMGFVPTVISLVFYVLPSPLFTAAALFHAGQTFRKFQHVQSTTRLAINYSANSMATSRSLRARRKLYLMMLCILLPYTPIEAAFLALNIYSNWPWDNPLDFHSIRHGDKTWQTVLTAMYDETSFAQMNSSWVPIVSALVAFVFFGTSKEGVNEYRRYLLFLGLGRLFPRLKEEYDPDCRNGRAELSSGRTTTTQNSATNINMPSWKARRESLLARVGRVGSQSEASLPAAIPTEAVSAPAPAARPWRLRMFRRGPFPPGGHALEDLELERQAASVAGSSNPSIVASSRHMALPQQYASRQERNRSHYHHHFLPQGSISALRVSTLTEADDMAIEVLPNATQTTAIRRPSTIATSPMPLDGPRQSQAKIATEMWSPQGRRTEPSGRSQAPEPAWRPAGSDVEQVGGVRVGRVMTKEVTAQPRDSDF